MIDVLEFSKWLSDKNFGFQVTYLMFPDKPDRAISFAMQEGADSKGTVRHLILDVYVRAEHPDPAVKVASAINTELDMTTRVFIDDTQIILIKALDAVPKPVGIDDDNRHIMSVQFKMLISSTDKLNVKE